MLLVHGDNMNAQKQKEKAPEEKPAVVPKLGKKTIEERYTLTVNAFIKSIEPELKKDINSLYKKTSAAMKKAGNSVEEQTDAFWTAVDDWLADKDNVDSSLQYVYLKDEYFDFKTGKLKLNAVKGGIKEYLMRKPTKEEPFSYKDQFIINIMKAQTPKKKNGGVAEYHSYSFFMDKKYALSLQMDFAKFFSKKIGVPDETKKLAEKKLPIVVEIGQKVDEEDNKTKDAIIFYFPGGLKVFKKDYEA